MRIMVVGGGGFVGSQVIRACLERGHRVLAAVRPGGTEARLAPFDGQIDVASTHLEDRQEVEQAVAGFEPDAVVHAAWYARPGDYLHSAQNLGSLTMTLELVDAVFSAGCRKVVGLGTCLEYAAGEGRRVESDRTDPVSLYASCKLAASVVCRARALQGGKAFVWARLFHVYGPGEHPQRLIPTVIESLRQRRPLPLSAGLQVRDPIHVTDVATGLACLAERGEAGIYNVCVGRPITLRETLETLAAVAETPGLLQFGARSYAEGELMHLVGDPTKLQALGWAPRFADLRAGLRDTLRATRDVA